MRHGRHAKQFARLSSFLGICAWSVQTLCSPNQALAGSILDRLKPAASQPTVLTPRTTVSWSIDSVTGVEHTHVMAGKEIIGPDGGLVLGPWGSVHVGGLTTLQAETAIERYLASGAGGVPYVANPRVRLSLDHGETTVKPVAVVSPSVVSPTVPAPAASFASPTVPASPAVAPRQPLPSAAISVETQQVAQLGAPAMSDQPGPAVGDWRPVQPIASAVAPDMPASAWRPVPRPGVATAGVVASGFEQPMPVGPVSEGSVLYTQQPADPKKADELKMPRPVPESREGPVFEAAAPPFIGGPVPDVVPPPTECNKHALPPYVVEPPDILFINTTQQIRDQSVNGQHLVRPDGSVSLGIYGTAEVVGLTLEQTKEAVARVLEQRINNFDRKNLYVDVLAYNSKWYYVITDGGGYGEQVVRLPITGSETVLDGISQIYGLPAVASKKAIFVARSFPCQGGHGSEQVLPVDWCAITQHAQTATNYQLMPGDRIYVRAQKIMRVDSALAKFISPIERVLGVTLLGSSTVNSIRFPNSGGNGGAP
jgi:polysaccharide biosynthesis/export protein